MGFPTWVATRPPATRPGPCNTVARVARGAPSAEADGIIPPYFTKVTSNGPSTVMKKVAPSSFVHAS